LTHDLPLPPASTACLPGSEGKLAVMLARAGDGYSLWHADDNRGDGDPPAGVAAAHDGGPRRDRHPRRPDLAGAAVQALAGAALRDGLTAHALGKRLRCSHANADALLCRARVRLLAEAHDLGRAASAPAGG
jgi:hypothetical protein